MIDLSSLGRAKVIGLDYPKPLYECDDDNLNYFQSNKHVGKFSDFVNQHSREVLNKDSKDIFWKQIVKSHRSDYVIKEEDEWTDNTVGFVYILKEDYLENQTTSDFDPNKQTQYFLDVLDKYNAAINGY